MHRYAVGDKVHYAGEAGSHDVAGEYEIVRLLPATGGGELQYRLKRPPHGPERVAREVLLNRPRRLP